MIYDAIRDSIIKAMYTPMVDAQFSMYNERLMKLYDYFALRRNAVKKGAVWKTSGDRRYLFLHLPTRN